MSTTETESTIESFDRIFGVDYKYRKPTSGDTVYNLDDGMVTNEENVVGLVFDPENIVSKFKDCHDEFEVNPVEREEMSKLGDREGEFVKFTMPAGNETVIQAGYLDKVAKLFDLETPIELERIEAHSSENVFPIRVNHDGNYAMIAPLMHV